MKRTLTLFSLTSVFLMGIALSGFGQTTSPNLIYNNGDQITIQSGAVLHVQGDYQNLNGGTTKNDGVLNVEGDLNNASTFSYTIGGTGERTIRLIGNSYLAGTSGEQVISGFSSTGSLYNLVVDRASAQVVRLGSDIVVDGSLVWNTAAVQNGTITAATYTPSSFSTTLGASGIMQVRTSSSSAYSTPTGHGLIKLYSAGGTDYELYINRGDYNAVAGYQTISAYSFAGSRAATTKDGYVETQALATVAKGFSRLINNAGSSTTSVYVFPVGGVNATYNPIKVYFNTLSGTFKLTSKFTDNLSLSSSSFYNHFDKGNSVSPASLMDTLSANPINYTLNPGYNIFQHGACTGTAPLGNWLILNKASLNQHGYWSFNTTAVSGTPSYTYTVEAYPHGYSEYTNVNHDPPKRMIRESTDAFTSAPAAVNFENELLTGLSSNSDLVTYTYYPNGHHKNFTTCNDGADGITGGMYSSFSHFGVGTNSVGNTNTSLPVKLIDLTATPIDNSYIRVDWATASEVDNKGFQVWRSDDGINFTNVGWVDGHGTTSQQNNYSFDDHSVLPGITYYYKLNQVDIDGQGTESWIVSAEITDGPSLVISELQPNPTSGATRINISTTDALPAYIKFYDIMGQEIISNDYQLSYGTNVINLQTANLANATYTVVIKIGNKFFSKKLVVVK